jgi:two-component system, OmpR family, KDP operon response regulator KdpE
MRRKARILVIDDDQPILGMMRTILQEYGFEPATAATAEEALELARDAVPDLVLVDLTMPLMSGAELIREFRRQNGLAGIPILVLSGHAQLASVAEQLEADGWIQKPFDLLQLIRTIELHLTSSSDRVSPA